MSKLVQLKHVTDGAWGVEPPPARGFGSLGGSTQPLSDFLCFWKKNGPFGIWITFRTFLEPFERTKFLKFESN